MRGHNYITRMLLVCIRPNKITGISQIHDCTWPLQARFFAGEKFAVESSIHSAVKARQRPKWTFPFLPTTQLKTAVMYTS